MRQRSYYRPTIGFLSTWSVYEGTTIDGYTHTLLQGISAAALDQQTNLLIGCGISLPGSPRGSRTAWPVPGERSDFVPVGPWNCDGLIIIPDDLTDEQFDYVQDLIRSGYPVILTTAEKAGPLIAVDNASGIHQAFDHLYQHGHRQIAFIAGKSGRGGDSAERLAAYRQTLREAGIPEDQRLIAFGEHRREDGRLAMQSILAAGAPFTALIASNDLSALGAVEVLREAGRRIPEDVAVIGFDDILEARSQPSPLTTVRHPTFSLGYQAVHSVLQSMRGERNGNYSGRVATRLVIRQSCGCRPDTSRSADVNRAASITGSLPSDLAGTRDILSSWMSEAALVEARQSLREEINARCEQLAGSLIDSLLSQEIGPFDDQLLKLIQWLDTRPEDAFAWQSVFTTLRGSLPDPLPAIPNTRPGLIKEWIDHALLGLAELVRRQTTGALVKHMIDANRLGLMTSQLLATTDKATSAVSDSEQILSQHLPLLGIPQALVGIYSHSEEDPQLHTDIFLQVGFDGQAAKGQFLTRQFPTADIIPAEIGYQLAVLPLIIDEHTSGFAAFSAANLEPCAGIVHNLASAMRASHLYSEALQGRLLAEEANRLKSRFLSIVSHELQTPLSLIVGLSQMMLQKPDNLPETTRDDLGQIHTSAQHLARLIGDVLDMASSEAGKLQILREPLDLADLLRVTARIGEELAREKGLAWEVKLPDHSPWVLGDRTRLRQVALNLISNAIKFTSQGKILLELAVTGQQAAVSVSDTGIGILPAELDHVFVEFQRSKRSVQSGYGGLGLGLAISKQLVEQHGGTLGVRSPGDLGCGSTFCFTLPVLSTTTWQDQLAPSLPAPRQAVFILSEKQESVEPLSDSLRDHGFDVRVCDVIKNPDWLFKITSASPAALILDEELAAREGWAITSLLKRQPSTARTPIFAYALDALQDRGELLEMNYLHKPLQADQLALELARYFGTNGFTSENQTRTVLLVDDDPGALDLHQRLVEQAGCRAILASSGKAALEVLASTRPDLILLDLMMPEMDGFTLLDILREREATRGIPVIILTARMLTKDDLERCNRGVAAILTKGLFSAGETLNHIEAALSRENTLSMPTQRLVRQAMGWVHGHFGEPVTREEIARSIGISPDYLTDCFRQELGITPITYLRRYRVRQACELLKTTDLSITQIAMAVGFSESAHFTRTFHREVGITPRAYRQASLEKER